MKKICFAILSLAFLAAGISSCTKTSKGKVSNEWKVTSYEEKEDVTNPAGNKSFTVRTSDGTTMTIVKTSTPSGGDPYTTTNTNQVDADDFTINKDGTWKWDRKLSVSSDEGEFIIKSVTTQNMSGTWNFPAKSKEEGFKKNERIIFNVLNNYRSVLTTSTNVVNNQTAITTDVKLNHSYLAGDNMLVYTVDESSNKKLQLSLEGNQSTYQGSETSSLVTSQKLTLTQK